jgi:argininosuccinate lyase
MKMWGGRFSGGTDADAWDYNASIEFDQRLGPQDVRGSIAWANALRRAGLLSSDEIDKITSGLNAILEEIDGGRFQIKASDEDIHSAVERRLDELIGPLAGKLHTGRSRNDQVATDLRLWLMDTLPLLNKSIRDFQGILIERAEREIEIILPGYTHLQRAQPISLAHWWLSFYWPLHRDRQRFAELVKRVSILPLGSAALAGTSFPIDRTLLARDLGFTEPCQNSIDGISDRDFVAEFLFNAALTGVHLSRLCESVILFSTTEFGFFELADDFTTGSSLMPQKKNPDIFELGRGKAGRLLGNLTGILTVLKGLPSTYDKDLQEDKIPLFSSFDTLVSTLNILGRSVESIQVHIEKMRSALDPSMLATDLADYLVLKGVPFREAHSLVGQVVLTTALEDVGLDKLEFEKYQAVSKHIEQDIYSIFDPNRSINMRGSTGGTAPKAVREQIIAAKEMLEF